MKHELSKRLKQLEAKRELRRFQYEFNEALKGRIRIRLDDALFEKPLPSSGILAHIERIAYPK